MSFDSVFDFTANVSLADQNILNYTQLITDATNENAYLATLTNYLELTQDKRATNDGNIANYTSAIVKLNQMLNIIQNVEALSSSQKNDLYSFYIILEVEKNTFAKRMLANYAAMLTDVTPILADQTLTPDGRYLLLSIVYDNYATTVDLLCNL